MRAPTPSSPYRRLILPTVFLFALIGGVGFSYRQLSIVTREFQSLRKDLTELEARANHAEALETRWERVAPKATLIESAFLSREDLPRFFESVEATAAAAGTTVTISVVGTSTTTKKGEQPSAIRFQFRAQGPFPTLFVFTTHLNVLPTLLFVEQVNFSVSGGGESRFGAETLPTVDIIVRVPLRGGESAPTKEEVQKQLEETSSKSKEEGLNLEE
jgi:hypothetical protein